MKFTLTPNRTVYLISCWLLGALFVFSGLSKGVNPFGLSLQFSDYFAVLHLDFLSSFSMIFSVALPMAEATLGVMLIMCYYRRITAWVSLLFMSFFTLLTLWIAVKNPVSDCGCFGDLLVISNWSTFYKNLFFMVPALVVFGGRNFSPQRWQIRAVLLTAMLMGALPLVTLNTLPLYDATPFRVGTHIWGAMHDGESAQTETLLLYRNKSTGATHQFYLSDTVWRDTTSWEYVDTEVAVLRPFRPNTITQLPMIASSGEDMASSVLQTPGNVLLVVSPNPAAQAQEISEFLHSLRSEHDFSRIVLLHPTLQRVEIPGVEVLSSDFKTLHTTIQNHRGGYLWLYNGTIQKKGTL